MSWEFRFHWFYGLSAINVFLWEFLIGEFGAVRPLRRYWSLRAKIFFLGMKLKNKIENVFHFKWQSTWTTWCPLRYYSQKNPIFLFHRWPRKLQNLDPISFFFNSPKKTPRKMKNANKSYYNYLSIKTRTTQNSWWKIYSGNPWPIEASG